MVSVRGTPLWLDDDRMLAVETLPWRDHLTLTREITLAGERTDFYERVRKGEFVSVRRGVYVRTDEWVQLNQDDRYLTKVRAASAFSNNEIVMSHVSAVALWRLPWVGEYPRAAHVIGRAAAGGRSTSAIVRHTVGVPDLTERIDGIAVTSLVRTVVDVARVATFAQAVTIADAALRRTKHPNENVPRSFVSTDSLRAELAHVQIAQGSAKIARVVEFANGAADRPGESFSRVNMSLAGITPPQLQVPIRGASGRIWYVDFWWPEFNMIGEFDGKVKYSDEVFLRGRTPQQAVYDEKLREDDLRRAGRGLTRWPWEIAMSPRRLRDQLIAAGVH
jgi:hypothetical protein